MNKKKRLDRRFNRHGVRVDSEDWGDKERTMMNRATGRVYAHRIALGAHFGVACILAASGTAQAAAGSPESVEPLRMQVPAIDRIDAQAEYVRRTVQGEKTGYIVLFTETTWSTFRGSLALILD